METDRNAEISSGVGIMAMLGNRKKRLSYGMLGVLLAAGLTAGLVIYFNDTTMQKQTMSTKSSPMNGVIVNCHPEPGLATEKECYHRGCIWVEHKTIVAPPCIFPEGNGYRIDGKINETEKGLDVNITRPTSHDIYGGVVYDKLTVHVEYQTNSRLRIKIIPVGTSRYEIPKKALDIESTNSAPDSDKQLYDVAFVEDTPQFGVVVRRKSDKTIIFSTDVPGFTFSDQFLQITTRLPSDNLYGFGEHNHRRFRHDMNWKTWSIFTRDNAPVGEDNLYGAHPVYLNLENDGRANMVLLKNSNAMAVTLQPSPNPAVTYRVIGGILDFYIFMGPSPEEAVQQYIQAIGLPVMPPYWSLGYHLCRWGYKDLDDMNMVVNRTKEAGIPHDGQWADIDHMFRYTDFTYEKTGWEELPEFVKELHADNKKFVMIVDPGIPSNESLRKDTARNSLGFSMFEDGEKEQIFVKDHSGNALIGKVWPGNTAYPDFTNPKTLNWWLKWMNFYNRSVMYDGMWIDMNEPSNFIEGSTLGCNKTTINYPPYGANVLGTDIDGRLFSKTLCMDSSQYWGRHYDVHNLYAHSEAITTYHALLKQKPELRPWSMTRSSFVGTGHYATKWMGDNQSRWPQLHWSIIGIMEFSMFGFAMNGADICGFWYEADYEMCLRWHQLGAFYPFARNHNGKGDYPVVFRHQDPASWDQRFVDIVKPVLLTRYKLLPYLYTLMFKAHEEGFMVMKALLFEFPEDKNTWAIDKQFLLGPALLLSPVLQQNQTFVEAYFPKARWYDYHTGEEIMNAGTVKKLYTPIDKFNLHIRGGYVIPWQEPALTTHQSRKNPFGVIIALDENQLANGELFWDDGEGLETHKNNKSSILKFNMIKAGELILSVPTLNYQESSWRRINTFEIYGLDHIPEKVFFGKNRVDDYNIRQSGKIIQIIDQNILLTGYSHPFIIRWEIY